MLSIAQRRPHAREPGELEAIWPEMERVKKPETAEWLGPKSELEEEEGAAAVVPPPGFLSAIYRAGDERQIVLHLDAAHLPEVWSVDACGRDAGVLLSSEGWTARGGREPAVLPWQPVEQPERLLVQWPVGGKHSGP